MEGTEMILEALAKSQDAKETCRYGLTNYRVEVVRVTPSLIFEGRNFNVIRAQYEWSLRDSKYLCYVNIYANWNEEPNCIVIYFCQTDPTFDLSTPQEKLMERMVDLPPDQVESIGEIIEDFYYQARELENV